MSPTHNIAIVKSYGEWLEHGTVAAAVTRTNRRPVYTGGDSVRPDVPLPIAFLRETGEVLLLDSRLRLDEPNESNANATRPNRRDRDSRSELSGIRSMPRAPFASIRQSLADCRATAARHFPPIAALSNHRPGHNAHLPTNRLKLGLPMRQFAMRASSNRAFCSRAAACLFNRVCCRSMSGRLTVFRSVPRWPTPPPCTKRTLPYLSHSGPSRFAFELTRYRPHTI